MRSASRRRRAKCGSKPLTQSLILAAIVALALALLLLRLWVFVYGHGHRWTPR